jgi:hypothetical protein
VREGEVVSACCPHYRAEVVYLDDKPMEIQGIDVCCKCDRVIYEDHPSECAEEY